MTRRGKHILARRLPDHPFNEINAENGFGDGMFDLQTRIHLKEIEIVPLGIIDEFDSTGRLIGHGFTECYGGGMKTGAHRLR